MIFSLLLSELIRMGVRLSVVEGRLKVHAPVGVLTEELRQAITAQKGALFRFAASPFVLTIDGLGYITGNRHEQDVTLIAEERKEALKYRIGVISLRDNIERFYYPRMVLATRPETAQVNEPSEVPS